MQRFFQEWNDSIRIINETNLNYPLHLHKAVELIYIKEGFIQIKIGGIAHNLSKGDLALICPGQLHSYESGNPDTKICIVIFDPSLLPSYEQALTYSHPLIPVVNEDIYDSDISMAFSRISAHPGMDNQHAIAWIGLIIALAFPVFQFVRDTDTGEPDLLYKLIDYLSVHFKEPLSLDQLAKDLNMNKYYLSHIFSQKLSTSFPDYVNQLRIDYATNLLATTNERINDIATQSGFETERSFHRAFKKMIGLTPTMYRTQWKNRQK